MRQEEINIIDYGHYTLRTHYCRIQFKQGGVLILTQNNIISDIIELKQYCREKDLEICVLKIYKSVSLLVLCVCRSPSGDFAYFLTQIVKILIKLYKPSIRIILGGDFNINFLDPTHGHLISNPFYRHSVWKVLLNFLRESRPPLKQQ